MNAHNELASFVDELKGVDPSCVHVENICKDDHGLTEWNALADEYREVKRQATAIAERETEIKKRLVDLCGSETIVQRDGLKVQQITSKGSIEWRKVPEVVQLTEEYLEGFRGKAKVFWKVSFCA